MKIKWSFFFALVWILTSIASGAQAAEQRFIVLPFTVNAPQSYSYLSKAIPGTLQSKLNKPGTLTGSTGTANVRSTEDASRALRQANADYAIWGVVNVVGNDCTIDVHSVDKNGKTWSKSSSAPLSGLTGTVQNLAASIGNEALGVQVAGAPVFRTGAPRTGGAGRSGSDIVVNETGQQQAYLNPQFRYQGAGSGDGSRIRTQRLKHAMVDMAVGDFNGDGKTEIAILDDHIVSVYIWEANNNLKKLGEKKISTGDMNFSMRAMDVNRDGAQDLVICTFEEENCRPYSYIYSFKGNVFSDLAPRIPYFVSVMRVPPTFAPVLVGQGYDSMKLFAAGVHHLVKDAKGSYTLGGRIGLPSGANVFNVAWIPAGKDNPSDLLVMLTESEKIRIYQGNGNSPLHTTMENFSGSATGMEHYKTMPGFGVDKNTTAPTKYYAPMRLLAADIGNTGENVLLLNRPISTAAQFFENYRYFPQGEIHALFWDGVGMALKWKTRRIRGSVAEIDLGDVNNDGVLDLVVGINTSPELGVGSRACMVTAYPLDVNQMDPNTPADMSDFEITPNR